METDIVTCPNCGKRNRVAAAAAGKPRCANCRNWLPWITAADDGDFAEIAEKASVPVLVDLWAAWCGPCRMVSPALEQLANERAGRLKLVKVDVDKAPAISERFTVQAVPTLLVIDSGQVLARQAGAAPVTALRNWLDQALSADTSRETRS
jgi:thioredoxin 2